MPIYEPDEATDVAIQSLLNQTWVNIEILIVDDASPTQFKDGTPTPYREQLRGWAARDSRIRLTLCEENRGAYPVRNDAFAAAVGEYVTVADKDDWHHPQKIERQARELMANPEKNANIVNWVRVDEDLKFLVRWGPDRVVHPSFASIMYRREEIQKTLGYWDAVRKSADGEYRTRYEITYGEKLVAQEMVPLAFSLLGEGNLTSTDFGLGYRHPDREIYQDAYTAWHRGVRAGNSAFLPKDIEDRRWVGPPSFLPDRDNTQVPHYDVIYVSEFGLWGGNSITLLQEIRTALAAGLRVGIVPLQNGLVPGAARRRMVPELRSLFLEGRVDRLHLQRRVTTDLLVIHWPAVMQLLPSEPSAIRASTLVTVANEVPSVLSNVYNGYDVHDVSENCFQTFGVRPYWAAQSEIMREQLKRVIPASTLVDGVWSGISLAVEPPLTKAFTENHLPVVGRPWDEEELNWPADPAERELVFPKDGSLAIAIRANSTALQRHGILAQDEVPEGWTVEGFSLTSFQEYLDSLDFLAVYPSAQWDKSIEPSVVEALSRGVVCIASPHLEPVYGDALVYAKPVDFQETVQLHCTEERYNVQRERGFAFLKSARMSSRHVDMLRTSGVGALRG
nr:glycosyltransferase family 2 protein [Nesterenkonia sp. Act20]